MSKIKIRLRVPLLIHSVKENYSHDFNMKFKCSVKSFTRQNNLQRPPFMMKFPYSTSTCFRRTWNRFVLYRWQDSLEIRRSIWIKFSFIRNIVLHQPTQMFKSLKANRHAFFFCLQYLVKEKIKTILTFWFKVLKDFPKFS